MPILEHSQDGQPKSTYEPLREENFQTYLKNNGKEKTEGYLEALNDILYELQPVLKQLIMADGYLPNSDYMTRKKLNAWVESKIEFLKKSDKMNLSSYPQINL